jgi:WS/DGAT/MGAT family acyltransferase
VAFARIGLEDAKAVKNAFGVKLNDVVLAVVAGALRQFLSKRGDEIPDEPMLAVCPISVRTEEERGTAGNKVSAMFTSLATQLEDPVERLRAIAASTEGAKTEHNAVGARFLTDWGEFAAPRTFALASRLYSSMHLADRHRPIHNLVISNVPGPPFPLYLAGAELIAAYPMGPIMEGVGLNVTVLSYRDSIDFGFMADRDLLPDIWDLASAVRPAFDELAHAAGVTVS